jgi:UDP:flavonoid glycosyltransferase YjiC (YdhE family)
MTRPSPRLRFLFATWEGGGSVAPALTVARKLVERGHEVRVMADACVAPESAAAGAAFTPWRRAPSRLDRTRESDPAQDWLAASPPEGLLRVIDRIWAGPALAYAQDLADELDQAPADLVVTSEFLVGVQAACEARAQPYANLAVNIGIFPTPGVPPLGMGLTPATNEAERAQHAEAAGMVESLFDHGLPALNTARAALGLSPLLHLSDQPRRAAATLLATSRAFDLAPEDLPPGLHYVGPQLGEPSCAAPELELERSNDRRPLVVVGFSTTYQDHAGALQRVVDALSELPVTGVVTLGEAVKPDEVAPAANVRIVSGASHDALMRQAALVVTHGGHGTVCRALAHHRPLLLMPHGRDQNDNAARVTARGAGLALPPNASVAEIRTAVDRLLTEPVFAQAAARLGAAVAEEAACSPVAEVLEDLALGATSAPAAAVQFSPA